MNDLVVDPALYRLRAFELDWIQPLSGSLRMSSARAGGGIPLTMVLLAEAKRWISIGQRVGYFADAPVSDTPYVADFDDRPYFDDAAEPLVSNPRIFASDLSVAREDLTPARRTFMRLLYFADSASWELNLQQASRLAENLTRRPWLTLPARQMDRLAWCLDGAEVDASTTLPSPADWRIRELRSETATTRWSELDEVRAAIAASIQRLDVDESTPATLRVAAEMQMRREGTAPPEADDRAERLVWEQRED